MLIFAKNHQHSVCVWIQLICWYCTFSHVWIQLICWYCTIWTMWIFAKNHQHILCVNSANLLILHNFSPPSYFDWGINVLDQTPGTTRHHTWYYMILSNKLLHNGYSHIAHSSIFKLMMVCLIFKLMVTSLIFRQV